MAAEAFTCIEVAKKLIRRYVNGTYAETVKDWVILEDITVVWYSWTKAGWHAIVSVSQLDGKLYQVSHNTKNDKTRIDTYTLINDFVIMDREGMYG